MSQSVPEHVKTGRCCRSAEIDGSARVEASVLRAEERGEASFASKLATLRQSMAAIADCLEIGEIGAARRAFQRLLAIETELGLESRRLFGGTPERAPGPTGVSS
jgi:hypothetical protein